MNSNCGKSRQGTYIKYIVVIAVFTALSAAGGLVKLPSPVGSIALDSAPGFFVAGFFNPMVGGFVGAFGHLASAAVAGFPLAFAHILIAVLQFMWCLIFGYILRKGNSTLTLIIASAIAVAANGVIAPLVLAGIFENFRGLLKMLVPFLLAASAINVVIAALAIKALSRLDIPEL